MSKKLNRILYIEDDTSIAELVVMLLEDMGEFTVLHSASGQGGIDQLDSFLPDLVITDVMMPDMDGIMTVQKIRQHPLGESLPVIFMTARVQTHEHQKYLELGIADVIPKPFDPEKLCDEINQIWDKFNNE